MGYETFYDEDGRAETVFVREEPDCHACCDTGVLAVNAAGEGVSMYDESAVARTNCPECSPTPAQIAAATAEYERRVAAGEITDGEAPF